MPREPRQKSPYAHVRFPAQRNPVRNAPEVTCVRIFQREYMHDMAKLTVREVKETARAYKVGEPVFIRYGHRPRGRLEEFLGYVYYVSPDTGNVGRDNRRHFTIFCIGASYPMKQPGYRRWETTPVVAVRNTIAEHRLSMKLESMPDARAHVIQQTGQSDWAFCVEQALKTGRTLYCNKTTVVFKSRDLIIHEGSGETTKSVYTPWFRYLPSRPKFNEVETFALLNGDTTEGTGRRAVRKIWGIDRYTGQRFVTTVSPDKAFRSRLGRLTVAPEFAEIVRSENVANFGDAKQRVESVAHRNRFSFGARATVQGNPRVHQGMTVFFQGLGDVSDGHWYVQEVEHVFNGRRSYTMNLNLGRDSLGTKRPDLTHQLPTRRPRPRRSGPSPWDYIEDDRAIVHTPDDVLDIINPEAELDDIPSSEPPSELFPPIDDDIPVAIPGLPYAEEDASIIPTPVPTIGEGGGRFGRWRAPWTPPNLERVNEY